MKRLSVRTGRRFAVFGVSLLREDPGKGDLGIWQWAMARAITLARRDRDRQDACPTIFRPASLTPALNV